MSKTTLVIHFETIRIHCPGKYTLAHQHVLTRTLYSHLSWNLRNVSTDCCDDLEILYPWFENFLYALTQDAALLVSKFKLQVTKADISDRYMGSVLSRWWAPFLPGLERTNCEEALCEEEASSCRQLNWCSVGSPLHTVTACLLKAGHWGLSLAEEFHSTRQHTNARAHTGNSAATLRRRALLHCCSGENAEEGGKGRLMQKLVS